MPVKIVKKLCDFQVFRDYKPEPEIIDTAGSILLANVPAPWHFQCTSENFVPREVTGEHYIMIPKAYLCHCAIQMGNLKLPRNLQNCLDKDQRLSLKYTVNQAVLLFQPEKAEGMNLQFPISSNKPMHIQVTKIHVINSDDPGVVLQSLGGTSLKQEWAEQNRTHQVFVDEAERVKHVLKNVTIHTFGNFGSVFKHLKVIGAIVGVTVLVVGVVGAVGYFLLHRRMRSTVALALEQGAGRFLRNPANTIRRSWRRAASPAKSQHEEMEMTTFRAHTPTPSEVS